MSEAERSNPARERRRQALWGLMSLVLALSLLMAVGTVTSLRAYVVPTGSMAPAVRPGDRVVASMDPLRKPRRGEIWIVQPPAAAPGQRFIKRVIGLPGETIAVAGGKVLINGQPLKEPYLATPPTYSLAPTRLGPDSYFVLGDSRNTSNDSHVWGPVRRLALLGRIQMRYWPPSRVGGP